MTDAVKLPPISQIADEIERLAFSMAPPNEYTPQFVQLAILLRAAIRAQPEIPDIYRRGVNDLFRLRP